MSGLLAFMMTCLQVFAQEPWPPGKEQLIISSGNPIDGYCVEIDWVQRESYESNSRSTWKLSSGVRITVNTGDDRKEYPFKLIFELGGFVPQRDGWGHAPSDLRGAKKLVFMSVDADGEVVFQRETGCTVKSQYPECGDSRWSRGKRIGCHMTVNEAWLDRLLRENLHYYKVGEDEFWATRSFTTEGLGALIDRSGIRTWHD